MALQQPLFINNFQKGNAENTNLGATLLGVETYSAKGVARLSKITTNTSGGVITDLPIYAANHTDQDIFMQGDTGKVYRTINSGGTWTDITNPSTTPTAGYGRGLIYFQGYLFAFFNGDIYYCSSPYGTGNWSIAWETGLNGTQNFPFLFPNDNFVYFGNGNQVGKFGFGTASTFNPAGSSGTDYFYTATQLTLPEIYQVNCMSFLPYNYLALGTGSSGIGNETQISDIILWNPTLSTYETPLRLFSQAAEGDAGVGQIINRNNTLYAVTNGNGGIYATNGSSFSVVGDLSLSMTPRKLTGTGEQATSPTFVNMYPSAIALQGHKLFVAPSVSLVSSFPSGYGLYPMGVWSVAFTDNAINVGGTTDTMQCEFPISDAVTVSNDMQIGLVHAVSQAQVLIGWFDGTNYGIDQTNFTQFQTNDAVVQIESPMFEIGTPLEPAVISNIQINLVRALLSGQTISVYYRTGFDEPFTFIKTFDSTSGNPQNNNSLKITQNSIGQTKYLQLQIQMKTASPNQAWSPEIRTIIVS